MLVASSSLSVFANDLKIEEKKEANVKVEDKIILIKDGNSAPYWLHCRIAVNSEGQRYYKWCRNETRNSDGSIRIGKYISSKYYPPM